MSDELIHRDDLPMELLEQIQASFPEGVKLICAGDLPFLPPGFKEMLEAEQEKRELAFSEGRCTDCGAIMPDWPPREDDDWDITPGWRWFTDHAGDPVALQCPACDEKEEKG